MLRYGSVSHIMKKQFEDRVRLAIYLEREDLNLMTGLARAEGLAVIEWARRALTEELDRVVPLEPVAPEMTEEEREEFEKLALTGKFVTKFEPTDRKINPVAEAMRPGKHEKLGPEYFTRCEHNMTKAGCPRCLAAKAVSR
jgi:hypothetical protein